MIHWTVDKRIAAGFALSLALVVVVAAVGRTAVRRAVSSRDEALQPSRWAAWSGKRRAWALRSPPRRASRPRG